MLIETSLSQCNSLSDPNASDELSKHGEIAFDWGPLWYKGQRVGTGQAPVKRYNRQCAT
jgi:glutathione-independent formaldehyde dehydrogenase